MLHIIRSHLNELAPYTPIEPYEVLSARLGRPIHKIIKLDANENPYGASEKTQAALAKLAFPHIYPDPESRALRNSLAAFFNLPMGNILCGSGADELIDLILRVILEKGDFVLSCPPTFGMYPFDTLVNAGQIIEVPRKEGFSLDLPVMIEVIQQMKPKVLFLAMPNNPDGSIPPVAEIEELLSYNMLLVLDEAFIEFCGEGRLGVEASWIKEVLRRDNLIVLRTFSKWAGLAGLRVGYGCFPEWIMPVLWNAKQPYNVNIAASEAAITSLNDADQINETVERICC